MDTETTSKLNQKTESDHRGCRKKLHIFFSNPKLHAVTLVLIVIDALIVLMLLLVDLDVIPAPGSNEEEVHKNKELIETVLHYVGLTILIVFVIEVILKMVAEGKQFCKQKLEVFDATVVLLSFILDITLTVAPVSKFVRDAVVLMILLRLWRFAKLIASVFVCVKRENANDLERERAARKTAEFERDEARKEIRDLKDELQKLRKYQVEPSLQQL